MESTLPRQETDGLLTGKPTASMNTRYPPGGCTSFGRGVTEMTTPDLSIWEIEKAAVVVVVPSLVSMGGVSRFGLHYRGFKRS